MKRLPPMPLISLLLILLLSACSGGVAGDPSHVDNNAPGEPSTSQTPPKTLQADYGVHLESKTVFMGALNDESQGPGSAGVAFANGKRLLARWIASGKSDLLPAGWKIELVERDHAGDPKAAISAYQETKDKVLCFATAYGGSTTTALLEMLKKDDVLIFPALITSSLGRNEYTPPAGPSYRDEALRALDWAVKDAAPAAVTAGSLHNAGHYGEDALLGWAQGLASAEFPPSRDQLIRADAQLGAALAVLKQASVSHVLLATSPAETTTILQAAEAADYWPLWLGLSPSWHKSMAESGGLGTKALSKYRRITGGPFLGEDLSGMKQFNAAWQEFGAEFGDPSDESLRSFIHGMLAVAAFAAALEQNDATRSGYRQALSKVAHFDALGMVDPMDFTEVPFRTSDKTRVLAPRDDGGWSVVGELQSPSLAAVPEAAPPSAIEVGDSTQPENAQPDSPPPAAGEPGAVPSAPAAAATASEVK